MARDEKVVKLSTSIDRANAVTEVIGILVDYSAEDRTAILDAVRSLMATAPEAPPPKVSHRPPPLGGPSK